MKQWEEKQARDEAFKRSAAARERDTRAEFLKQRREKQRNRDWWPRSLFEGVDCQRQVCKILRVKFARA
jgi:hypothetical protein